MTNQNKDHQLCKAVEQCDYTEVRRCLDNGANPNCRISNGDPILIVAMVMDSDFSLANVLIQAGADVNCVVGPTNIRAMRGATPLHFVVAGEIPNFVMDLLDLGADVNAMTHDRKTPLDVANEHPNPMLRQIMGDLIAAAGGQPGSGCTPSRSQSGDPLQKDLSATKDVQRKAGCMIALITLGIWP